MTSAIIAWYGLACLAGQWCLVGPYPERDGCTGVMEWLQADGYETETCSMLSTGSEAILVQVGERPYGPLAGYALVPDAVRENTAYLSMFELKEDTE